MWGCSKLNVLLIIADCLRAGSLEDGIPERPRTPFLDSFKKKTTFFRKAYATECWTLPSHASMFTGLLPAEHGAHFQTMAYDGDQPTVAELLSANGFYTEVLTRNPIFDGTIRGITRGFQKNTRVYASVSPLDPAALILSLNKPRFRRQIRETGFFSPSQQIDTLHFLNLFAQSMFPADIETLERVLGSMQACQANGKPYFLFTNLFDVHAPYCPNNRTFYKPIRKPSDFIDNLVSLRALTKLSSHKYLKSDFRISDRAQQELLRRYHRSIELLDAKLEQFFSEANSRGLLADTMVILAGDHGEAFGEHDLYFHDASVFNTNIHVPLWVHHPHQSAEQIDDVVSLRSLFDLIKNVALDKGTDHTILNPEHRMRNNVAFAHHFYYPRISDIQPIYAQNQVAAITDGGKIIARGKSDVLHLDLHSDPQEENAFIASVEEFDSPSISRSTRDSTIAHLNDFRARHA